ANLGRDLADEVLVAALDQDFSLAGRFDADAFGNPEIHRMAETKLQIELLSLNLGTIPDADQLELLLEAFGHAVNHVGYQRAHRARHRHGPRLGRRDVDHAIVDVERHRRMKLHFALGFGALDPDHAVGMVELHALWQLDGCFGNSRHCSSLRKLSQATRQSTSPPWPCARAWPSDMTPCEVLTMA